MAFWPALLMTLSKRGKSGLLGWSNGGLLGRMAAGLADWLTSTLLGWMALGLADWMTDWLLGMSMPLSNIGSGRHILFCSAWYACRNASASSIMASET